MEKCLRERFVVIDDFLPAEQSDALRADIDRHFADPQQHDASHQVWNYWHVPGSYTYLRTTPDNVFGRDKTEAFVNALRSWAALNLGLAGISWPFLSLYVPGCLQGLHNDSVNGRLGYVYSLTRNERKTIGGETVLVQDCDLFRTFIDRPAAGVGLFDLVEPRFNRLTLFDDRIPHAVQRLEGSMDPVEGRFVLHGHISEAGTIVHGALAADAVQAGVNDAIALVRENAGAVRGPIVFQLDIAPDGTVEALRMLLDRLASGPNVDLEPLRQELIGRVTAARFPDSSATTRANVPIIF